MHSYNLEEQLIFKGSLMLALCCGIYLIWWSVAFRPEKTPHRVLEVLLFLAVATSGICAVIWIVRGVNDIPDGRKFFPQTIIIICGIAAYFLLLSATQVLLHRQVTTELLLIVAWAVLEFVTVNALYGAGIYSKTVTIVYFIIALAAAVFSMVCYLKYYEMEKLAAF